MSAPAIPEHSAQPSQANRAPHPWRFFRIGGFDQVRLDNAADLLALDTLDQKLWVALACPTAGLEFDPTTLALLDADRDGRIRAPDLIAALQWTARHLHDAELLARGTHPLPLAALARDEGAASADAPAGGHLLAAARALLIRLGRDANALDAAITADDAAAADALFASDPFNGDGVITGAAASTPRVAQRIDDILTLTGSAPDRSGQPGITQAHVDDFFAAARALADWQNAPSRTLGLLPLGADSLDKTGSSNAAAASALAAVRAKIDDYFTRCRLAAFDARATTALNGSDADFLALGARLLANADADAAALPLARVEADRPLPLTHGVNPAWAGALQDFIERVLTPLAESASTTATTTLTEEDWCHVCGRFAAYLDWQASKPATPLSDAISARFTAPELADLLASDDEAALSALIAADAARADEAAALADVQRLVLYVRDLAHLADNFVAFRGFYTGREPAIFQSGTLYLDGRSCNLCIPALDPARHAALAAQSGIFLAYCDCVRGNEKRSIAAAFTAGDSDQLTVGRNGVFYDRQGRDWDATITRIVDNPISLRQAFWSPYKKLARLIGEQLQKVAAARAKAVDDSAAAHVLGLPGNLVPAGLPPTTPAAASAVPPPAKPAAFDAGRFAGIFAAIGLAIGAIGAALASLVTGFLGLPWWQMPIALAGLLLIVSGPAVALAAFRLRNRNLAPLLDANGWAVNARARINIPFGTSLTHVAKLPAGAERSLSDPYAEKKSPWGFYAFLLIAAALLAVVAVRLFGGH
ncbi:hypothetical protein GH865_05015 [Rhodocyclus tenuis]|uniref:hypothetical protein n=1 Tax=Rhodocyclus gracilis TaxID=2929842 RepID=UPI001298B10C|nr:hypothetical protein [Rhodocyclus gracilis]MRD72610.1 hypothetical protein [Rhodocyclus gracilis]